MVVHVLKIPIKYVAALGESMARAWESRWEGIGRQGE